MPLRILMVLRAPLGGLYRHVMDLTEALSVRGHQIGIIMDSILSDAQTGERLRALSTPPVLGVHRMPISRLLGPHDISATRNIRKIADQHEVDVLHGHGAKGGFNARLARWGSKSRIAAYTPHGGVLNYERKSLIGKTLRTVEKIVLPLTDAMIFESDFVKQSFVEQIGPVPKLGPVILNGLDAAEFEPLDPASVEFDFAFVGELRAVKGLSHLLDALVDVKRPDGTPATLLIGGAGPEEGNIRAQMTKLGLDKRVTLAGVQPAREIFARAHFVVMPSLAESLPYVALEAAAAQKPLIATDVGGVKEIFGPTASHLLPAADVDALRKAMQDYVDNPASALSEMRQRLEWIKNNFSMDRMTDAIEDTYYQALEQR
ncbi:MAG TPA: glycosyltransferase family 1 protein [Devosia sp.]|nr:glycosyltransferase family 1 protein [Devosia sp.]